MKNETKIAENKKVCFYCKRFFCTKYHRSRNRMVCSGILPRWEFLWFLMKNVRQNDTCKKFVIDEIWKDNQR